MFMPIPPLTLRLDSDRPMMVRINAAAIMAKRLSYSISKLFMPATPRCFCRAMYSLSCGEVRVCSSFFEMRKSRGSMPSTVSIEAPLRMVSFRPSKSRIS